MTLRLATAQDIPAIQQLTLVAWQQFEALLEPVHWEKLHNTLRQRDTYEQLVGQSTGFLMENEEGHLIGTAFWVSSGHPTALFPADWSYIRFVTVAPTHRGQGIGRQLTSHCIELAKARQEKTIALHTSECMPAARRLYESLGFTVHREIEPRFGKKYWLYVLPLPT